MKLRWLVVLSLLAAACHRPQPPVHAAAPAPAIAPKLAVPPEFAIPLAPRPPVIAQHDDDAIWQSGSRTGPWLDPQTAEAARPFSNARLLWDAHNLYISLYAADQNIQAAPARHDEPLWPQDAFSVRIQADLPDAPTYAVDIAPTGTVTDLRLTRGVSDITWESGAQVSMDMDGTLNDPSGEDDEEWVAFVALPWDRLAVRAAPGVRLRLDFSRCDVPKDGIKRCGQWRKVVLLGGKN